MNWYADRAREVGVTDADLYPVLREIAPGSETTAAPAEKQKPAERKIWKP